jgi:hypothetical protein
MSALHDTIHAALIAALAKHGQSACGVCAQFDPVGTETKITGYYKLRFVTEDMTKAIQAKIDADTAAATKGTPNA